MIQHIVVPYATETTNDELWLHNVGNYGEWYGTIHPVTVSFVANPHPMYTKVFDNFEWSTQVNDFVGTNVDETFDMIGVVDDTQVSVPINLTDLRLTERIWRVPVGRSSGGNDRIRDKYMKIKTSYSVFSTQYEQDYVYCIAHSSATQENEKKE